MGESGRPTVYTARYFALEELASKQRLEERIVPIRISLRPCIAPLSYEVGEVCEPVQMNEAEGHPNMEWYALSPAFWSYLDGLGVERVAGELAEISGRHGGKPLCLVCYENLVVGDACQRRVFQAWWEERTGEEVLELTEHGEALHHTRLHRQRQVRRPR